MVVELKFIYHRKNDFHFPTKKKVNYFIFVHNKLKIHAASAQHTSHRQKQI